jgi:alpha-D-ribose 1-methylphosphonate 5-triphosphate synthase subunit PhnG
LISTNHEEGEMRIFRTEVDLALRRPPRVDVTVYGIVAERNKVNAELTAVYMAMVFHPDCVMAVGSRSEEI